MGYTHYWYKVAEVDAGLWQALALDVRKILQHAGVPLSRDYDKPTPPEVTSEVVYLNGVGDDGHEPFVLDRVSKDRGIHHHENRALLFSCCKTAYKPYDVAVTAVLCAAKRHLGADIVVASDGERKDWDKGRALHLKATGVESPLPFDPDADDR